MTAPHQPAQITEEPSVEAQELAAHALRLVKAGLTLAGLLFAWIKLSGTSFISIANSVERPPRRGAALFIMYGAGFLITGAFLLLAAAGSSPSFLPNVPIYPRFSLALAMSWILNVIFWYLAVKYVWRATFRTNREHYKTTGRFIQLERLAVVEGYLTGQWQWSRFVAGLAIVAVMLALSVSSSSPLLASRLGMSPELLIALSILTFVGFLEACIWLKRVEVDALLGTLRKLSLTYVLVPRADEP